MHFFTQTLELKSYIPLCLREIHLSFQAIKVFFPDIPLDWKIFGGHPIADTDTDWWRQQQEPQKHETN